MNDAEMEEKYGFVPHPVVLALAEEYGLQPKWVDALVHDAVVTVVQLENAVAQTIDPVPGYGQDPKATALFQRRLRKRFDELIDSYASGFDGVGHIDENMPGEGHRLDPATDQFEKGES